MKKLLSIGIVVLMIFCFSGCKERFDPAPQITEGEFPFVVEYEINGERHLIEDMVVCRFDGYNSATNNFAIFGHPSSRKWSTSLKSGNEDDFGIWIVELDKNTESIYKKGRINYESFIFVDYGTAEYYMGDTEAIFYDEPRIRYFEKYYNEDIKMPDSSFKTLTNEELEKNFGIKIIRFEFSEPIENKFE